MAMENCGIPLCLPDNFTWDPKTNECKQDGSHRSGTLKVVDTAKRQLQAIQSPICVVAIAGPCRQGKSYILPQLFVRNRDVFPLGHEMDPKTVGLWMWVVPEKYEDPEGEKVTVVLIDSEGTDSTAATKSDVDMIFTLAVLLSSVLIYNCAAVPKRSDLEELSFVLKLSQRIQVFTGKDTTDTQAQKVFPSFVWLIRDRLLDIPGNCKDLKEYFLKHVFHPSSTTNPKDNDQQVSNTILKCFPSFDAFSLPLPSFEAKVVQSLSSPSSRSCLNPKFSEEIDKFSELQKTKLCPKKTPDGNGYVTGEALASMFQTYVETMNTPGAVPSVVGAWEKFIDQKSHEIFTKANDAYLHQMKHLEKKLPCDSIIIRKHHYLSIKHFKSNVINKYAKREGISAKHLEKYMEAFQVEAEAIESSWYQRNDNLTEKNCEKTFKELKERFSTPPQDIWDTCKHACEAETRIRNNNEKMVKEFRTRSRGSMDIIEKCASKYEEELVNKMNHDIAIVKTLGRYYDEKRARELENNELSNNVESLKTVYALLLNDLEDTDDRLREVETQNQEEFQKFHDELQKQLLRDKQILESQLQQNQADTRRGQDVIENNNRRLERRFRELERELEENQ